MIKRKIYAALMLFGFLTISASAQQCIPVGGTALANAISKTDLVAALSGDMTGARAKITKQTTTDTGLLLNMEHFFVDDKGGMLETKDRATLTKVVGKNGTYMLEINYKVVKSYGSLDGYKGSFSSYGLIKLDEGKVVLRYKGELCK